MKYLELKQKHQQEFNEFSKNHMFYAFSEEQFIKGMKKLGLNPDDTDKIYSSGAGGYYKKEDAQMLHDLLDRQNKERLEAMQDDECLYQAFYYELGNHEYAITGDAEETLLALGLSSEALNDKRIAVIFTKAKAHYLNGVSRW
jgi:hypothetical protein